MPEVKLKAHSAAHDLLPAPIGGMSLGEETAPITSVAPFKGQEAAVTTILGGWPEPGAVVGNVLWSARGQAFVIGACPDLTGLAAVTDQSDAWAYLVLEGAALTDVLARLCPLDLDTMAPGQTARSLLGHMNALYWRQSETRMALFVFRSMARTAVTELVHAMERVAARNSA